MKYALPYGIALVIFLALDALWLGLVAKGFYAARMGELMADPPRWGVAALFYAVYVVGLVYFAVSTGLNGGGWQTAAFNGALYGFFCYLTYDATNLAVMKGYDPLLAVVDTIWGTVLSATASAGTILVLGALGRE